MQVVINIFLTNNTTIIALLNSVNLAIACLINSKILKVLKKL